MKKIFSFLLIALLVVTTITPTATPVSAQEDKVYANGEYALPFEVLQ